MAAENFAILVRCDFPEKEQVLTVSRLSAFADLRKKIGAAFEIDAEEYGYFSVSYMSNVVDLRDKTDAKTIEEMGVKNRSVLFVRAPAYLKPNQKRRGPEHKLDPADRFKGLTVANAISKLKSSSGEAKRTVQDFIFQNAADIIKEADFLSLDKPTLQHIIKSDDLVVPEIDLFEALVKWAEREAKEKKLGEGEKGVIAALDGVLIHVRFPTMPTEDFASRVVPKKLLPPEQVLEFFTYLGASDGRKPPKSIAQYNSKPRTGARVSRFAWSPSHMHSSLSLDGMNVTSSYSGQQLVASDTEFKSGIHKWEIVITAMSSTNPLSIGVIPASFSSWTVNAPIGEASLPGWSYLPRGAKKVTGGSRTSYGIRCKTGDVILVQLDLDKGTLQFSTNGHSHGVAFKDVKGPVRPACTLYSGTTISLRFDSSKAKKSK